MNDMSPQAVPTPPWPASGPARQEDMVDLGALFHVLWRGVWTIALVALTCLILGGYYAYQVATPVYRASATLLLEQQQTGLPDMQGLLGGITGETSEVNSELEVLRARVVIENVVTQRSLITDPEFNTALRPPSALNRLRAFLRRTLSPAAEATAAALNDAEARERIFDNTVTAVRNRLSVRNIPNSLVFEVSFESEDPRKAAALAQQIAEAYLDRQVQLKTDTLSQASTWLATRVGELQTQLEAAEQARAAFGSATDLVSIEGLQMLERQVKDLRDRLSGLQAERATLLNQQGADPQTDHTTALARLDTQISELTSSAAALDQRIAQQNADLIHLQQLNREAESIRLLYETFLTRLNETAAQQGIQQPDSVILSDAVIPQVTSAPRKSLLLAASALFGLLLGAGIVLIRSGQHTGFRSRTALEELTGIPVAGQLPLAPFRSAGAALPYLTGHPRSALADALRNLRISLTHGAQGQPPQTILVSSAAPAEGKTLTSIALATQLAALDRSVLLIEGDLHHRSFANYFNGLKPRGLASVLTGAVELKDVLLTDPTHGLDILAGGDSPTAPADLFSSDRFEQLIEDLATRYDHIVIDTAPVLAVPDARIMARVCDQVLLCVKWNATPAPQVSEALRLLRTEGPRGTELVLTQITPRAHRKTGPYAHSAAAYA